MNKSCRSLGKYRTCNSYLKQQNTTFNERLALMLCCQKLPSTEWLRLIGRIFRLAVELLTAYWPEFPTFTDPSPYDDLTEGIPSSYRVHIWQGKTRMAGLQSGEGRMMIDSVVWAQYINVTDRHTDKHTEKPTDSNVATANAAPTHCDARQNHSTAQWQSSINTGVLNLGSRDPLGVQNGNLGGPKRKSGISTNFPQYK